MARRRAYAIEEHRDVETPGADGTTLLVDRYSPVTDEPRPTFLLRTPYGATAPIRFQYGKRMARRGYHAVIQRCRGTFGSSGPFEPMVHEADDGQAVLAWLRSQPWFSGRLVTAGASYLGFVQWALGADAPPELVAQVIEIAPFDFATFTRPSGSFRLRTGLSWADQVTHQEANANLIGTFRGFFLQQRRLRPAYTALPLETSYRRHTGATIPFYESWLQPGLDGLAEAMDLSAVVDRPGPPRLIIGGWNDIFATQTIASYERQRATGTHVSLLMGPWTHLGYALGARDALPAMLRWLDQHVDGTCEREHGVRVHVGGSKQWRTLPAWPPATETSTYWLAPHGVLSGRAPSGDGATTITYDAADPTPDVGGPVLALRDGPRDTRPLLRRSDVAAFTSEPLADDTEVHGEVEVRLSVTTSSPHADVFVRLCDVADSGKAMHVTDALVRLTDENAPAPDGSRAVTLRLTPTAHRFAAGHRLRLLVSGAAHPRYARNLGSGEPLATGTRPRRIDYVIHHDAARPAVVELPITPGLAP
ncbi:MAG TPA: CocE/NonD family hydrolase [Mycobacteriales bacterium]|nr:CocE/NonD family hydrolase [Mycobacteriales bacterium]